MSLLGILGVVFIMTGVMLLGVSVRYFYLWLQSLSGDENFTKSIFKKF